MEYKRQAFKKDRFWWAKVSGVAVILIVWLTLAGNTTNRLQFYVWALVAAFFWAEAMYNRDPERFGVPMKRRIVFIVIALVIMAGVSAVAYVIDNPEVIEEILGSLNESP